MPTIICDLDGVVWRGSRPIEGAAEAIAELRRTNARVLFVTNNSHAPVRAVTDKLAAMNVPATEEDVVTSAQAAARLLDGATNALVVGGEGIIEALHDRGIEAVHEGHADAVVVGFDPTFTYARLRTAMHAITAGARFVATNEDATYPTDDGEIPGGGSIVAAVSYAASATPEVAGKPHPPCARLVEERAGPVDWVVGDRLETDGAFATALGARFGLVLTGVTTEADAGASGASAVAPTLLALVPRLVDGSGLP
jgi:4-nitrophenyl phosphatase